MAKKHVIAYYMHEWEQSAALSAMPGAQATESFAIGDIEEEDIPKLQEGGVIVEPVTPPAPPAIQEETLFDRTYMRRLSSLAGRDVFSATPDDSEDGGGGFGPVPAAVDFYEVRLRGPLLEPWREELDRLGVTLLEALDRLDYKARLRLEQVSAVGALSFVARVRWINPEQTVPQSSTQATPAFDLAGPGAGVRMLTFDVRTHRPEDLPAVLDWLRQRNVAIAGSSARKVRCYFLENDAALGDLAALPEVDAVAEYVPPEPFNDAARRIIGLDAPAGQPAATFLTQDGAGQIVGVADTGIDAAHPDFQGRIIAAVAKGRATADDPDGHGTHVAGSVLGDGAASQGVLRGVAPGAKLYFQSLLDNTGKLGGLPLDLNDLFDEAYQAGVRIHNNSWGSLTPSSYTINSEEVDEAVRRHPDLLVVIAAGNAGTGAAPRKAATGFVDWLSIGSPASCKNALTVGASRSDRKDGAMSAVTWGTGWPSQFPKPPIAHETVSGDAECLAAFSSRGPCDDRRIKPDLVAPGTDIASTRSALAPMAHFWGAYPVAGAPKNAYYAFDGGTSMATPIVSGCAALVRQYYQEVCAHDPSAALLKATLVNSTVWLSGADSRAPTNGQPNYHQGHGRICLQNAVPNQARPDLRLAFVDDWQDPAKSFSRTGARRRWQFQLPAGSPDLRFCMAYTDAPARGLQNNLNLIVQHLESGKKWQGNIDLPDQLILPDPDNNLETVRIDQPPGGTYFVQVFAGNLLKAPQDFALVVTGVGLPALTEI